MIKILLLLAHRLYEYGNFSTVYLPSIFCACALEASSSHTTHVACWTTIGSKLVVMSWILSVRPHVKHTVDCGRVTIPENVFGQDQLVWLWTLRLVKCLGAGTTEVDVRQEGTKWPVVDKPYGGAGGEVCVPGLQCWEREAGGHEPQTVRHHVAFRLMLIMYWRTVAPLLDTHACYVQHSSHSNNQLNPNSPWTLDRGRQVHVLFT